MNTSDSGRQSGKEFRIWKLFQELRTRGFSLGMDDYLALWQAARMGFGLLSKDDFREICCLLWAKSTREQEILVTLFERLELEDWDVSEQKQSKGPFSVADPDIPQHPPSKTIPPKEPTVAPITQAQSTLPLLSLEGEVLSTRPFILVPQLPITYREISQAWRRLRRPIQVGPPTEIDIEATVAQRSRVGVAVPIVLKPRRRNIARLFLLIDRQGSMAPFHRLCEEVSLAAQQASRLEQVTCYYYHNLPNKSAREDVLQAVAENFFPNLDSILAQIKPINSGYVYKDPALLCPQSLEKVLSSYAFNTAVVIVSDAGAARGNHDTVRLLNTIAFLKALRTYTDYTVWINPLPIRYWKKSTAELIARHIPMFQLDRMGLYRAVNVLRGQPVKIERPL